MNLKLKRLSFKDDGVSGHLFDSDGTLIACTIEHAYEDTDGNLYAKIPTGTFSCQRGLHRLHNMADAFETFEITGVEGHTNLLFHWGNYNCDSEGCLLLGNSFSKTPGGKLMITQSRNAFAKFMALQEGVYEFTLTVE